MKPPIHEIIVAALAVNLCVQSVRKLGSLASGIRNLATETRK